jgi:uncharacterized OsmC-like protein
VPGAFYPTSAIRRSRFNSTDEENIMTAQATAQAQNSTVNGVNVDKLMKVITSVEQDADNAKFQFRLNNRWVDGGLNRSRIKGFYANGSEDDTRTKAFIVDGDEPTISAGTDSAPNPMEFLLHSLAGCLTSTMVNHAAVQGIEIESVESSLEGDMDVRGMLGLSDEVRKGYSQVRVHMRVKSGADAATLEKLALFSPVYDIVSRSLPVEVVLEKI